MSSRQGRLPRPHLTLSSAPHAHPAPLWLLPTLLPGALPQPLPTAAHPLTLTGPTAAPAVAATRSPGTVTSGPLEFPVDVWSLLHRLVLCPLLTRSTQRTAVQTHHGNKTGTAFNWVSIKLCKADALQ